MEREVNPVEEVDDEHRRHLCTYIVGPAGRIEAFGSKAKCLMPSPEMFVRRKLDTGEPVWNPHSSTTPYGRILNFPAFAT